MKPVPGIKKILLISPDYMSFTGIIGQGIKDNLAADVELFYTTGKESAFKYRSFFHRVQNYFSKLFLKRNLKKVFYQNAIQKKIIPFFNQHPHFDYILILRPDLILEHLPLIKKHGAYNIAYFWDSFARIPLGKETIPYFDKFFSFEPRDAKDFNLSFLPNFYYPDAAENSTAKPEYDLTFFASFDKRFKILLGILRSLKPLHLKTEILILASAGIPAKYRNETAIQWIRYPLTGYQASKKMRNSRVLLDIVHPGQEGLSFRFFEALNLRKKIITTNQTVTDYDFYKPQNIFVWHPGNTEPPADFFTTPYSDLPEEMVKKYSLSSWIRQIFNEKVLPGF